nr:putative glycerol-3-phosphate transporter 4 [Ipomoea batatas]
MSGEVERITKGNPPGISVIRSIRGKDWSFKTYRYVVLFVTFIAYTSYHASRKPSSIVKSVLDPKSGIDNATLNSSNLWPVGDVFVKRELELDLGRSKGKGWEPFNGKDGMKKLGEIDVAFLACYSIGMYVAGHLGDSLDLRLFLTAGMIGSGVFVALFGMGYFWNIHEFWFYLAMQMGAGLFQATGWPSVVANSHLPQLFKLLKPLLSIACSELLCPQNEGKGKLNAMMPEFSAAMELLYRITTTLRALSTQTLHWGQAFAGRVAEDLRVPFLLPLFALVSFEFCFKMVWRLRGLRRKNPPGISADKKHQRQRFGGFKTYKILADQKGKGGSPFNGEGWDEEMGKSMLLSCVYSIECTWQGILGDYLGPPLFPHRWDIGSGVFVALFGDGYFWNIL